MKLYNEEVKQKYLERFSNEDTRGVYTRLFQRSRETEEKLGKDIYNFSDNEMEDFLRNTLRPKTKESARTYCNVLANYVQWAIDNSHITGVTHFNNPLKRRQEYFFEFVPDLKLYISKTEKMAIMATLLNKQDSFIIDALWEGIQGRQLSELVNLRLEDVRKHEGVILLRDDNGIVTRKLVYTPEEVLESTIFDNAVLANKEKSYYKNNGVIDHDSNISETFALPFSDYVLKSAVTNSKNNKGGEKVSYYTIYNRLEMIRRLEGMEEYADALTTVNIVRSGMIHMASKLYQRDGEIGTKQIKEICARYNLKYKWSLKDFLNVDMVKSLYPELA